MHPLITGTYVHDRGVELRREADAYRRSTAQHPRRRAGHGIWLTVVRAWQAALH